MHVRQVIQQLGFSLIAGNKLDVEITGGYASDLLSCVMARAQAGNIWVTLQAHPNIVAVASLIELSAVIITEDVSADPETVLRAQETGIPLLTTAQDTYTTVVALAGLGIGGTGSTTDRPSA